MYNSGLVTGDATHQLGPSPDNRCLSQAGQEGTSTALSCGLIGLPACGKTTIFNAITAAGAATYSGSEMNRAVVAVPDRRIQLLADIYHPAKTVAATVDITDIPGLQPQSADGSGRGLRLLSHIKDVEALLHVVRCFEDGGVPLDQRAIDPARDVETVDLELMVADGQTLLNKINRLARKARSDPDTSRLVAQCQKVKDSLDQGIPVRRQELSAAELDTIRDCNLLSIKPVLYIANVKSVQDQSSPPVQALQAVATAEGSEMVAICGRDEAEISELDPADRQDFLAALGLQESSMERLLRAAYRMLGLVSFFTTGEDEVHAWTCRQGDLAPVAAGKIHTDMEKGFIRMEVMRCEDLLELGSEAAVARAGKQRVEGKAYQVQDGDIVVVLFNPT
ncbi:MAG: redox-regulated ATPase YchF [Chloroflexi bacterium]|nr:redox-regulated ATPase YchF [Chloroflexota bacterium]